MNLRFTEISPWDRVMHQVHGDQVTNVWYETTGCLVSQITVMASDPQLQNLILNPLLNWLFDVLVHQTESLVNVTGKESVADTS